MHLVHMTQGSSLRGIDKQQVACQCNEGYHMNDDVLVLFYHYNAMRKNV